MSTTLRFRPFFDSGLDTAFDDLVRRGLAPATSWVPAADIVQVGEDAVITLEVPGISTDDIEIEVRDRTLTVRGQRDQRLVSEDAEGQVVRREIRHGEFSRGFRLPAHVAPDAVRASYDNGLLTITVGGAKPAPVTRRVPIEGLTPTVESGDAADPTAAVES